MSALSNADNSKLSVLRFKTLDHPELNSIGEQYATVQDQQGFMWFGGSSGLARYDSYSAKVYRNDPQDPHSLSHNWVEDLLIDGQNQLWVATRGGGLNRHDPSSGKFTRYQHDPDDSHSLSNDNVTSLFERKDGKLWVATRGGGLNLFDPDSQQFIRYQYLANDPSSIASNNLRVVYEDHEGMVWIGTYDAGLIRFDPKTGVFRGFSHNPKDLASLSHNYVYTIFEDSRHQLWIGTWGGGLNQLVGSTGKFLRYRHDPQNRHSLGADTVTDVAERDNGTLWIATDGGLNLFDPVSSSIERYSHNPNDPTSLPSNKVRSIYQDKEGDWWFGDFSRGVSRLDRYASAFSNYQHEPQNNNSLSNNSILRFEEDKLGNLWVGTEQGLNYLDRSTGFIKRYTHDPQYSDSLGASAVLSLLTDSFDELWVGTWGGGLSHLNSKTAKFNHYQSDPEDPNSISGDRAWTLYEDINHRLWIGTETGGLNRYDRETDSFSAYQTENNDLTSITSGEVFALYEDRNNRFWVGTPNGLNLMDRENGTFTRYQQSQSDPTSISANFIWSIAEDSKNRFWLGTHGGGLNKLDRSTGNFTSYRAKDGLPSDTITGIVEDDLGYLWLSTLHGLSRFDPNTEQFRNYTTEHGLPGNVFNRPAFLKTSKGELVFGSTEGFTIFDPSTLFENIVPPPVILTDFQLFNQPVEIAAENSPLKQAINHADILTLRHDQSVFSLGFAALNYRVPEMNQYAYKLEGFDNDWNWVGNRRTATYTNIDPGHYVFRVKAANNEGVWNEQGTAIQITILPPWWRTWWAYSLYLLIVFTIVSVITYLQVKKLQERKQLKLALWGSGDELWDVNLKDNSVNRQNKLDYLAQTNSRYWHLSSENESYIHTDDRDAIAQQLHRYFAEKNTFFEIAYRAKTTTGSWIWLLDRGQVTGFDNKGAPIRFTGTTKNIDHLKMTEAELVNLNQELEQRVELRTDELNQGNKKLEQTNKKLEQSTVKLAQSNEYLKNTQSQLVESEKMAALGSLVVGVSHELNTPVGIALTALTVLQERSNTLFQLVTEGKLTTSAFKIFKENSEQSMALVFNNLNRTSKIVNNFKSIAADSNGENLCQIELKNLLSSAISNTSLKEYITTDNIIINCPTTLIITSYQEALFKVVKQLLQNIIKHAYDPNETIKITINVKDKNNELEISIQDEGKGMTVETLEQIFEPFYTTNRGSNIGLGLHAVYNQVHHLLKGSIECSSELNKGSTFILNLPRSINQASVARH